MQRPDTGEWVTVGRYTRGATEAFGHFQYAPSYAAAGLTWAIDPVNLPFVPDVDHLLDLSAAQAPQHVHCLSAAWRAEMLTRIAASIALLRTATAG